MISVIIPVYNAAEHIIQCFDSLRHQTFEDWEAIFINDGSTDESINILNCIAQSDSRVTVINKINEGVAIAREAGIKKVKGEYITFLDVDDTFTNNALEVFSRTLNIADVDVVVGGINIVSDQNKIIKKINYSEKSILGPKAVEYLCKGVIRWQLCGKAYKTSLFRDVHTPSGLISGEDMAVCIQAMNNAIRVNVITACLYNYIQINTSVTHSKGLKRLYHALESAEFVKNTIGKKINSSTLDCLFLLIIFGSLRSGLPPSDKVFKKAIAEHGNIKALSKISLFKAFNLVLFKYFSINLVQVLYKALTHAK